MTPGEIARWTNATQGFGCDLTVVPMRKGGRAPTRARDRRDARVGPPVAEHADARNGARLSGRLPRRGHEPLRGPRHDAAVRAPRRAVARRGRGGGARERARDARRRLPPARLQADVPEARGQDVRRRAGARDGRGRVPAVRDVPAPPQGALRHGPGPLPLAHREVRIPRRRPRDRPPDGHGDVPAARRGRRAAGRLDRDASETTRRDSSSSGGPTCSIPLEEILRRFSSSPARTSRARRRSPCRSSRRS